MKGLCCRIVGPDANGASSSSSSFLASGSSSLESSSALTKFAMGTLSSDSLSVPDESSLFSSLPREKISHQKQELGKLRTNLIEVEAEQTPCFVH